MGKVCKECGHDGRSVSERMRDETNAQIKDECSYREEGGQFIHERPLTVKEGETLLYLPSEMRVVVLKNRDKLPGGMFCR